MTKVLLIVSPFHTPSARIHVNELLGIEYLGSAVRQAGHDVEIWDPTAMTPATPDAEGFYFFGASPQAVRERLRRSCPEVVGISLHYKSSSLDAFELARVVKEVLPYCVVVVGGLYISVHKTEAMEKCEYIDYSITGEADDTFIGLLTHLEGCGQPPDRIEGLIFREGGGLRVVPKVNYIADLDCLTFPARDLVDIDWYMTGGQTLQLYGLGTQPALSILTSRSCPYRCTFCNMNAVHGARFRPRSPENVVDELEEMQNHYGARHVFIMDDSFTFKRNRAKAICEEIIRRDLKIRWNTPNGISVKGMDQELASLMKRAGCANACVAIESGSDYIRMEVMQKNSATHEIRNAVEYLNRAGIPVVGFFLLGMPGESEGHYRQSYAMAADLPLTSIVVSLAVPFPGTRLYEQAVDAGIIESGASFGKYDYNSPTITTADFSHDDLVRRRNELLSLYPSLGILKELESCNDFGRAGAA